MAIPPGRDRPGEAFGMASGLAIHGVEIPTAPMRALNTTPYTLVPAQGTGKTIVVEGFALSKPSGGAAFGGIASGEDLEFRYTNAAGLQIAELETTGFLAAGGERHRWVSTYRAASGNSAIEPVNNGAIVVRNSGAISGGRSVFIWTYFRILPIPLYV